MTTTFLEREQAREKHIQSLFDAWDSLTKATENNYFFDMGTEESIEEMQAQTELARNCKEIIQRMIQRANQFQTAL